MNNGIRRNELLESIYLISFQWRPLVFDNNHIIWQLLQRWNIYFVVFIKWFCSGFVITLLKMCIALHWIDRYEYKKELNLKEPTNVKDVKANNEQKTNRKKNHSRIQDKCIMKCCVLHLRYICFTYRDLVSFTNPPTDKPNGHWKTRFQHRIVNVAVQNRKKGTKNCICIYWNCRQLNGKILLMNISLCNIIYTDSKLLLG